MKSSNSQEPPGYLPDAPLEAIEITGLEFKRIREMADYSRKEVATMFGAKGQRHLTTERGLIELESRAKVDQRYTRAFIELLGRDVYKHYLNEVRRRAAEMAARRDNGGLYKND